MLSDHRSSPLYKSSSLKGGRVPHALILLGATLDILWVVSLSFSMQSWVARWVTEPPFYRQTLRLREVKLQLISFLLPEGMADPKCWTWHCSGSSPPHHAHICESNSPHSSSNFYPSSLSITMIKTMIINNMGLSHRTSSSSSWREVGKHLKQEPGSSN